jgi:hypothetical protein
VGEQGKFVHSRSDTLSFRVTARGCFSCGYDLEGVRPGSPCPECGAPALEQRDVLDHAIMRDRRNRWITALGLLAMFFVFVVICTRGFGLLP